MKTNSCLRGFCCLIAALLLLGLSSPALAAQRDIDMDRKGSIVLRLFYDGRPVSGGELRMYKVGEVELVDGSCCFRLSDAFDGRVLNQAALDSPELAGQLAEDIDPDAMEFRSAAFGADGKAVFSEVTTGLYLLVQTEKASGFQRISPILVPMPYYLSDREGYSYEVDATVKPSVEDPDQPEPSPTEGPPEPTTEPTQEPDPSQPEDPSEQGVPLPQTGQLKWPVPVMAGLGLCFAAAGVLLILSDKRRNRS